ncbi:hypothetical protein Btru_056038 [Bulinus truncatus]|nr:hypothetical protein Btru_056038 [Bulinus truncatus]
MVLETVVEHNESRESLQRKKRAFEAWRQVVEVLLTSVPHDLLSGERRQVVLLDLLQELLLKVSGDDVSLEAASLVSDVILTLMANLRHCFLPTSGIPSSGDSSHPFWVDGNDGSRNIVSTSLQIILRGIIDYILKSSGGIQKVRVNLYGALLYCLQIAKKPRDIQDQLAAGSLGMEKILSKDYSDYVKLATENMVTITSYGNSFMETLSRDACDGHHVGRMLALSVLDTVISMDNQHTWLNFICGHGYLQHLVDSVASEDDGQLQAILSPQPANLRALYIFQSKMSLLTRVAETQEGARILLHGGALEKLASCSFLSLRPEMDEFHQTDDEDDLLPSPMARYHLLLFAVLRFCLALLTSLGGENKEAATQVMLLIISHGDVFTSILRSRKPTLTEPFLLELSLTTAVIARANYHRDLGADLLELDTANMEFKSQRMRLQDQMVALLPHYVTPETVARQLKSRVTSPSTVSYQSDDDTTARILQLYQEVACNLTAYCRSLIADIGNSSLNQHLLFGPSLEEVNVREGTKLDEVSVTLSVGRRLGLGVIVLLLQQSARHFSLIYESYLQLTHKLTKLAELTAEDLKQLCGDSSIEKLSLQQRQDLARSCLVHLVSQKVQHLQHYLYIVENCLYIIWRHMEFFLVHCIPADQSSMTTPSFLRHKTGIRKLTGASESYLDMSLTGGSPVVSSGLSQVALGVTRNHIDLLRSMAPSVLNEAFFKKIQNVDQVYGKHRTHYSFSEAIVRRIKRVLKLHAGR